MGFEMARAFAQRKHPLIISGSREGRLSAAKALLEKEFGRTVETVAQDLSQPGGAEALHDKVAQAGIEVEILVNNAGMGLLAASEEIDFKADEALMRLNMIALVELCKLYLPEMYRRGHGKILNVASVAAFQPGPYNATYFASKAFVLSYSRAIRHEAKDRGVQVCTLCPGTTRTDFFEKEGMEVPPMADSPERVAQFAYRHLMRNQTVMVPGLMNRLSLLIPTGARIGLSAMMKDLKK
jgi:short-subunit dehydrogenase